MDPDLELVLDLFARSATYYRHRIPLFLGGALFGVVAGVALWSEPARAFCGFVFAALMLAIAYGSHRLVRRYTEEAFSPVLRAVRKERDQIELVAPRYIAANPRGLGITAREQHYISIRLRGGRQLGVRVEREQLHRALDAFARLAPKAEVDGRVGPA